MKKVPGFNSKESAEKNPEIRINREQLFSDGDQHCCNLPNSHECSAWCFIQVRELFLGLWLSAHLATVDPKFEQCRVRGKQEQLYQRLSMQSVCQNQGHWETGIGCSVCSKQERLCQNWTVSEYAVSMSVPGTLRQFLRNTVLNYTASPVVSIKFLSQDPGLSARQTPARAFLELSSSC